jgi:hypothetical protein
LARGQLDARQDRHLRRQQRQRADHEAGGCEFGALLALCMQAVHGEQPEHLHNGAGHQRKRKAVDEIGRKPRVARKLQ